ncbi:hypothetical protein C0993_006809 [Termitomyces sp. T159_Od127]|nr:hypothetical protein C0993_006809 [Termitomyces sp. T159_Od127]
MRFSGIFVVSSLIASAFALPTADFTPKLKALTDLVKTSTVQVKNFDGSISQFSDIDAGAQMLAKATMASNMALMTFPPFNQVESSANLVASEALVSGIESLSDSLIDKKPAFKKIGKVAAVENDARAVAGPAFSLMQGLIERTPAGDKPKAKELQQRAINKFAQLLKEFMN